MGWPKPLLPVAGTTLVEWIADRLAGSFEELLVAVRSPDQVPPRLRPYLVLDRRGAGPLAGVEAGLAAARHPLLVAVACDLPGVTEDLACRLAAAAEGVDAAVPRIGGRPQPACAAYRRSAAPAIADALEAGRWRATEVLERLRVRWLDDVVPELLANLNTPADYRSFLDQVGDGGTGSYRDPLAPRREGA
jgi:molybdopterin-guanine dinucleotide biosynthesis protein A